jgi:hypothetical protein
MRFMQRQASPFWTFIPKTNPLAARHEQSDEVTW